LDDGSTTAADPCDGVECQPDEACIEGFCFPCPSPACDGGCAEGERCQCPPDDLCCAAGTCTPLGCPPSLPGNYAPCIDADGMLSDAPCYGASCVSDGAADPTVAVCMSSGCEDVCQCPTAPGSGDAVLVCEDITGDLLGDCWLSCESGETCPDGMVCFGGIACLFPVPAVPTAPAAYGDCADNPVSTCLPGEDACLGNAAETAAACSQSGCVDAAGCPAAPPTGNAPVACGDLGGGNTCFLDCAGGQACPGGTTCTAVGGSMACLWPDDGFVLDEDFEQGALRPGWSLIDVDGHTPDPSVSFVSDAWVVTDEYESGTNFGAYSTSWYAPAAQADDWLITPQITLGPASDLSWQAWAPDATFPDGYQVRISTGMPTVVDFMANPALLTIADEADSFTSHAVDLAAAGYVGQAVYIAFRNDSNDEFILVVDDVRVTE
jgi:hypothetical protein